MALQKYKINVKFNLVFVLQIINVDRLILMIKKYESSKPLYLINLLPWTR